jgi:hypothetical protein
MFGIMWISVVVATAGPTAVLNADRARVEMDSTSTAEAVSAAEVWIDLLDSGEVNKSWSEASQVFRGAVTSVAWAAAVSGARAPFMPLGERSLESSEYSTTIPGAPPGEYAIIQFRTRAGEGAVVETVVMMLEVSAWRTAGYFIHPADS